ncbi:hypothetical protein [Streptomyces atratus]|uniref:hypothetical protein n=1 Tax=Streptomyces atratus TaxID=1893 RepID=UPI0037943A04
MTRDGSSTAGGSGAPTDCLGLLLVVAMSAANTGDREAAVGLLTRLRALHRDICLVWADAVAGAVSRRTCQVRTTGAVTLTERVK